MSLRILHTADNHIGLSFNQYPEVQKHLIEERFASLERMVAIANERKAHFIVVAGDLFDKTNVTKAQIERAVKTLGKFEGEAVLVLAGNHDFCEGPDSKLWKQFRTAADGGCVLALTVPGTKDFESDDFRVRFHACPCPSKHGKQHTIGWVADEVKPADMLHIGIAHGNVEGLGLDADQRYFNMAESDFRNAGLHTWLLGHIHVPAPAPGTTGKPLYFMPGIHTPDSVKCSHPGHAWWIEMDADGSHDPQAIPAMLEVLRIGREKLSDKGTKSANKRVDPLRSQTGMTRDAIIDSFLAHFAGRYATTLGAVRADEVAKAEALVAEKFSTEAWINLVP